MARNARLVQLLLLEQPTPRTGLRQERRQRPLGLEPAQVRARDCCRETGTPVDRGLDIATQKAFGGEKRHLGVVRNGAAAVKRSGHVGDRGWTEARHDLRVGHELDRSAQRIADRTAKQAAPVAALVFGRGCSSR